VSAAGVAGIVTAVEGGIAVAVHVQPGARRSGVVGRHGDALKVKVAAPPVDGRANDAVAGVLAELFGVAVSAVELRGGASSRSKRFVVTGVELARATALVRAALDAPPLR
jgi:uncharacterized protein (TIGR00251 family)